MTSPGRVLLTGGTGFIASHILDCLLEHGYTVIATVRSQAKADAVAATIAPKYASQVQFAIVKELGEEGAFDEVMKASAPLDYVIHTAAPVHSRPADPIKDVVDPIVNGATGILASVQRYAPEVARVILTSSAATIVDKSQVIEFDESCWSPLAFKDAHRDPATAYGVGKVLAEKASWDFMAREKPSFDFVALNPTWTFGPIQRHVKSLDYVNETSMDIRNMIIGKLRGLKNLPLGHVNTWVDVKDVAQAHVKALSVPEVGGQRILLCAGLWSNKRLADIVRNGYPVLEDALPASDAADDLPNPVRRLSNTKSQKLLGINYKSLERSVKDAVDSMLPLMQRN